MNRDDALQEFAAKLVDDAARVANRTMYLSVFSERKPVPFPTHWTYKNLAGVSFKKKTQTAEAIAWVKTVSLAGYGIVVHLGHRGGGGFFRTFQFTAPRIIQCEQHDTDRWKFWCNYCERYHFHSAAPGHRAAHCHSFRSPYQAEGYILELREAKRR